MSDRADVLILGGGVIGLTTALFLAREGVRVCVIDRGEFGRQASWAGAGIIPPGDPDRAHGAYERLRALSSLLYPDLSRALREQTGIDNGYVVCGGIELPDPMGGNEGLPTEEWQAEGIAYHDLDRRDLLEHAPELNLQFQTGVWLPQMAQVRNPRHLKALIAGCAALGVGLGPGRAAQRFRLRGSRIEALETEAGEMQAEQYLLATGAWTDDLLAPLGWRPLVRPVRGQIALLQTGDQGVRPILLQGKRYLVPRGDGRVLVGSTEEEAGFDARPTAGAIRELLTFSGGLLPVLAGATLERCWAGLRPGSVDGLPYLGTVPGLDNLFVASGHFRAGLQLSPATGLVMAQRMLGRSTAVPLDDFRLDRPPALPVQTAFRS